MNISTGLNGMSRRSAERVVQPMSYASPQPPPVDRLLFGANIQITGTVDTARQDRVIAELRRLKDEDEDAIIEITTTGGDADAARRIASDITLFCKNTSRNAYIVGRTHVFSAGVTILASVPPSHRYLTSDTLLLIHERRQSKSLELSGPLRACLQIAREEVATLENSIALEKTGFQQVLNGSDIGVEELIEMAATNLYVPAAEALRMKLVARIIP